MRDAQTLASHIDVTICRCGLLVLNHTGRAHQKCPCCGRHMCAFCNCDWDPAKMRDETYQCGPGCHYAMAIQCGMTDFNYSTEGAQQIPDQRCCPKCFVKGAYGNKCKYHSCRCGHSFCFFCLKPEAECKKTSSYGKVCTLVRQTMHSFPHLGGVKWPLPPAVADAARLNSPNGAASKPAAPATATRAAPTTRSWFSFFGR
jgi:hypothetical protein